MSVRMLFRIVFSGSQVLHELGEALALEDVAASESNLLFDVRRAEDLGIDHGGVDAAIADIAAEAGQGFHDRGRRLRRNSLPAQHLTRV